jgi:hypothetical protein
VEVGVFIPEHRGVKSSKELIVNLWKRRRFEGRPAKTRQSDMNLSSAFQHKWRKMRFPGGGNPVLAEAVERAGVG